jgi:tight adherence protein B
MSTPALVLGLMVFGTVMALAWAVRTAYTQWRSSFLETAKLSLEDMFLFVDPRTLFRANVAAFVLLPAAVWVVTREPIVALAAGIAGAAFPRVAWIVMRRRRRSKLVAQLPDGLSMMVGSIRAGSSLVQALSMVVQECAAPLSQELSLLLREQRLGLALDDSLRGMAHRLEMEEIDLFVSALSIAKEVGGNLSETLDRLASTLRAKAVMEGKIRALTSQGKLQGVIVGLLPLLLGSVLYVLDPEAMLPMFTTWYGWCVIAAVFVMLLLGAFFIRKIVTIDV